MSQHENKSGEDLKKLSPISQHENKSDEDLSKIDNDISFHRIMIFLILLVTIIFYMIFINFDAQPFAASWGPVGDFFGGILNPIFALFAFYWITYSVRLQIKELKETRAELKKAAQAQEQSAKHQEEIARLEGENVKLQEKNLLTQIDMNEAQQQQVSIQNFESLFFQLLKTKTDITNDILVGSKGSLDRFATIRIGSAAEKINEMVNSNYKVSGKESIKDHLILFKAHVPRSWEDFYTETFLDYAGSYFRISYQIVKLIDDNEVLKNLEFLENKKYSKKQKEYFDIFRATFSQYELEAFFFNCLSKYGNTKFKELLEKYGMFEPLLNDIDRLNECIHPLTNYAYRYDKSIFEENKFWIEYFEEIENLKTVDFDKLLMEFSFCFDENLILVESNINPMSSACNQIKFLNVMLNLNQNERFLFRNKLNNLIIELEEECRNCVDQNLINKLNVEINDLKSIEYKDEIQFILLNRINIVKFKAFLDLGEK